jgi:hypothetical protein
VSGLQNESENDNFDKKLYVKQTLNDADIIKGGSGSDRMGAPSKQQNMSQSFQYVYIKLARMLL